MTVRLLDLFAPPSCWACRNAVHAGSPLCPGCASTLPWRDEPIRLPRGSALDACAAPLALAGPARELVHALKFGDAPSVARLMAAHVVHALPPGLLDPAAVLVPVPGHPGRRRRRGYDHADALAAALHERTDQTLDLVLTRAGGRSAHQRGRGRAQRLAGEALALSALGPASAQCVLVDDVRTTGATLEACARALRAAGARRVAAIAYAQAL